MFHFGKENGVARANKFSTPRLRYEIDALGRAACEDDLIRAGGADIVGHIFSRVLVGFGRTRAQFVETAMHVRVFMFVVMPERIEHGDGLLRSGGAIKV